MENIPDIYVSREGAKADLMVYDLQMRQDIIKAKVNLTCHMFSFLQAGEKQVHLSDASIHINNSQSLLIRKGNCIWSELIGADSRYYCRLLFFSISRLQKFLAEHSNHEPSTSESSSHFVIENDEYIDAYLASLSTLLEAPESLQKAMLSVKFEELLLYLLHKYGQRFADYLHSLITEEAALFRHVIDQNVHSNLSLEEIAFLCNVSLSTFKRKFTKLYGESPGKWFKEQRLQRAKALIANENARPSDIYFDLGYSNLSNFSIAFKKRFGVNPSKL